MFQKYNKTNKKFELSLRSNLDLELKLLLLDETFFCSKVYSVDKNFTFKNIVHVPHTYYNFKFTYLNYSKSF